LTEAYNGIGLERGFDGVAESYAAADITFGEESYNGANT
jgi:hypothetical protein